MHRLTGRRRAVPDALDAVRYAARASVAVASQPYEGLERAIERVAEKGERVRRTWRYVAQPEGEARLHALLGEPWPCPAQQEFEEVWSRSVARVRTRSGEVGRGAYNGWDDADAGLARVAWCLVRHLRPEVVIETGVARGLTTSVVLEGLEANGDGRLWSVDVPPLIRDDLADETGAAVEAHRRRRWTLLRGSSRRMLPGLVDGLRPAPVDLFLHDSLHTTRNVRFELERVWPALAPGGVVLADDIQLNRAFGAFTRQHPEADALVFEADDGRALFGCLRKRATPAVSRSSRAPA
jgi:predicted O-methyltransferase YrrM